MSLGLFFFDFERNRTPGKQEGVGYRCLSSFLIFQHCWTGRPTSYIEPWSRYIYSTLSSNGGNSNRRFWQNGIWVCILFYFYIVHLGRVSFRRTKKRRICAGVTFVTFSLEWCEVTQMRSYSAFYDLLPVHFFSPSFYSNMGMPSKTSDSALVKRSNLELM